MKTLIFQSCHALGRAEWLKSCLHSTQAWAEACGYDYYLTGDEMFELLPEWYLKKTPSRKAPAADLGRLLLARQYLERGYQRVIWLDADVYIFDPDHFEINVLSGYAFGREVWVQPDNKKKGGIKAYWNAHNALCIFVDNNNFLDFYIDSCLSIMKNVEADHFPAQLVGPKFLTALHHLVQFPLLDEVGMVSPLVASDLVKGKGPALDLMLKKLKGPMRAANLCSSLIGTHIDGVDLSERLIEACIEALKSCKGSGLNPI